MSKQLLREELWDEIEPSPAAEHDRGSEHDRDGLIEHDNDIGGDELFSEHDR